MKKSPAFIPKVLLVAISIGAITSCATSVSGNRAVAADGRAIHRAEQLSDFNLKEPVKFDGIGTKAALEKLDRAYRDTCRTAGQVPLDLAYEVPAGYNRPLNFTVTESFEQAVAEIAATSKLEVTRRGNTYRFQAPKGGDGLVQQTYQVPPDFVHRISSSEPWDSRLSVRVAFEKRGVSFDESTRLTLQGSKLGVETRDRGDETAISATVEVVKKGSPRQIRVETQTFEIPSGSSWDGPEEGIITGGDLAKLRRTRGVEEVVQPFDLRSNKPSFGYVPGGKMSVQFSFLGLGIQGKAVFDQRTPDGQPVVVEGQTPNGGTRIATQARPDGSRVVVAVTPTIVDATGRPVTRTR